MKYMGRYHGRKYRDWSVTAYRGDDYSFALMVMPPPLHYHLDMVVTEEEGRRLMEEITQPARDAVYVYRGAPSFSYAHLGYQGLRVSGIEITEEEVFRITRGDEDPYDVIVPAVPACGYRLYAVNDPLLGTTS